MPGVDDVLDLSVVANPVAPDVRPLLRELVLVDDRARPTRVVAEAMAVEPERLVLTDGSPLDGHLSDRLAPGRDVVDDTWLALTDGRWTSASAGAVTWHTGSLDRLWGLDGIGLAWVLAPSPGAAAALVATTERPALVGLSLVESLVERTDPRRWSAIVASLRSDVVVLLEAYGFAVDTPPAPFVVVHDGAALVDGLATQGVLVAADPGPDGRIAARLAVPDGGGLLRLAIALRATTPFPSSPTGIGAP